MELYHMRRNIFFLRNVVLSLSKVILPSLLSPFVILSGFFADEYSKGVDVPLYANVLIELPCLNLFVIGRYKGLIKGKNSFSILIVSS